MYYLNKIVGWVLSPLGILFLGLGLAWLVRPVRWRRAICGVTLAVVWILGCGVTMRLIGLPLEVEEIDEKALPAADAIVLLGGGMGAHRQCGRAEMFGSADRVWMAARLFRLGKAPKMTLSGKYVAESTVPLLKDFGVPEEALLYFPEARNTEEESEMIAKSGIRKILLVTSAWHMPRAKMLFVRKGFEVIEAPTDYEMHGAAEEPLEFGDFLPNADALLRNGIVLKEWVARFGYGVLRR